MRRVLQNLIIAFTVIFLFTGMFLYRKSEYVEASGQYTSNITIRNTHRLNWKMFRLSSTEQKQ